MDTFKPQILAQALHNDYPKSFSYDPNLVEEHIKIQLVNINKKIQSPIPTMSKFDFYAIKTATSDCFDGEIWYTDEKINNSLSIGVKNGWIRRPSTTQCEWTKKGVDVAILLGLID